MEAMVKRLAVFSAKGQPGVETACVRLLAGRGIEGDRFARGGEAQVTAAEASAAKWARDHPGAGLCCQKFKANVELEGLRFADLLPGDRLFQGEAALEITRRKECFPECVLARRNGLCPLCQGVLFLKVLRSGELHAGQTVRVERQCF